MYAATEKKFNAQTDQLNAPVFLCICMCAISFEFFNGYWDKWPFCMCVYIGMYSTILYVQYNNSIENVLRRTSLPTFHSTLYRLSLDIVKRSNSKCLFIYFYGLAHRPLHFFRLWNTNFGPYAWPMHTYICINKFKNFHVMIVYSMNAWIHYAATESITLEFNYHFFNRKNNSYGYSVRSELNLKWETHGCGVWGFLR